MILSKSILRLLGWYRRLWRAQEGADREECFTEQRAKLPQDEVVDRTVEIRLMCEICDIPHGTIKLNVSGAGLWWNRPGMALKVGFCRPCISNLKQKAWENGYMQAMGDISPTTRLIDRIVRGEVEDGCDQQTAP